MSHGTQRSQPERREIEVPRQDESDARQPRESEGGAGREEVGEGKTRGHGRKGTREYVAWKALRWRCRSNHPITKPHYKDKGITVCERWDSFMNFLADMGDAPSPQHEIDRKDNNGNYEPGNCRWVTNTENVRNRSISKRWIVDGIEYESLAVASEIRGVSQQTIKNWCEGKTSRKGIKGNPKPNCRSYKPYDNP